MIATPRLMHIVNAAFVEDIKSRAMVHDSFGFWAAQAGRFRQIILQPFVKMCEQHDVLADDGARRGIRGIAKDLPNNTPDRKDGKDRYLKEAKVLLDGVVRLTTNFETGS
jgi:hypothetical protein